MKGEDASTSPSISVLGKHALTIVDGKEITATNAAEQEGSRPVAVSGRLKSLR